MRTMFEALDTLLLRHAPGLVSELLPGASVKEIEQAEERLGCRLPDDLRAAFQWHNGQSYEDGPLRGFLGGYAWMCLDEVVEYWLSNSRCLETLDHEWSVQDDTSVAQEQRVRFDWWNPAWIPIGDKKVGTCLFVDLAPAPSGRRGQLVAWSPDSADGHVVLADSFESHLAELSGKLERGLLEFSSPGNCWIDIESGLEVSNLGRWSPRLWN